MLARLIGILLFFSTLSFAGITDEVRESLAQKNLAAAESRIRSYRTRQGVDADYLEALSWIARASLLVGQLDRAESYAKQTDTLCRQLLLKRPLDAEPHLPIALGAALEVQAQVLAARGDHAQAVALLRRSLNTYRNTSIRPRLQKNLNLLDLAGQPAPSLQLAQYLGPKPPTLSQLHGSPVLLFFWAHWCADCKVEGPVISRLRSEFGARGLTLLAPTQLYGYAAQGEDAQPQDELPYIKRVWQHFYPGLQNIPVPVSQENFNLYGASTTPTLVLLGRDGRVALYHPGLMPYEELRSAIDKVIAR
ncbi:MAG TPA: TlpA disulfide reductase family protein [Terriglobales bacterium]|jgi:thiol-disulfide isomerase/thioredoxin|nr:TlpA disulfide reductase family protein [Terriglobales bacterium]